VQLKKYKNKITIKHKLHMMLVIFRLVEFRVSSDQKSKTIIFYILKFI